METNEFLSAVLPTQGKYCVFSLQGQYRKNIFVDDIENVQSTAESLTAKGTRAYFAMATFDDEGSRKAEHALFVRDLFMDLDCGWMEDKQKWKAFHSKKDAVEALHKFLEVTGLRTLGEPWLVDSGSGVHVHWPLTADATAAEWLPVARALKAAAAYFDFPIDETVTDDIARVLGVPGTLNCKHSPPKPVVLRHRGSTFDLARVAKVLASYAPKGTVVVPTPVSNEIALLGPRPTTGISLIAKAMAGNSVTYFKDIMVRTAAGTGCGQIAHYMSNAQEDGLEPLWRGILSIAKCCEDGDKAARKLSLMHPYDLDRMYKKLADIKGPYSCEKLGGTNSGVCDTCQHRGKITNPLALGRTVNVTTQAPESIAVEDDDGYAEPIIPHMPNAPRGFGYGANGGIYIKRKGPDDETEVHVMLTPFYIFMTRQFNDMGSYLCEFVAIKKDKRVTFAIPTELIPNTAECVKILAKNNILSIGGGAHDKFLADYIRASMIDASSEENTVNIPPRFGWQDDGSFAVHDTVYSPHSPTYNYNFVSPRMQNLMQATKPKGTLEDWQKVLYMMRNKAATDKRIWGHLAVAGVGFGSILMHFMPPGSNAATIHVCSAGTGSGKTLALSLATSVWGDKEKYVVASSTSERTMMQRAGLLGNLPLCVDEITSNSREMNREYLPKLVFDFAAGMHKIKGTAAGNTEITHELMWASMALFTSNTPGLEAMMGARKHTSEGEARRMLEWELPKTYTIQWTPAEREIMKLLPFCYGVAGPLFAQWCVLHQERVQAVLEQVRETWVNAACAGDEERFWTSAIVCDIAGWILAGPKHAGIISMPVSPIMDFWLGIVERSRKIIGVNQMSALDVLNSYIRENNGDFVRIKGSQVMQALAGAHAVQADSARNKVRGRIEYDTIPGYVSQYIELKMLRMHCAEVNMGYSSFLEELSQSGIVKEGRKDLLAGTSGAALRVLCLKITRPIKDLQDDTF